MSRVTEPEITVSPLYLLFTVHIFSIPILLLSLHLLVYIVKLDVWKLAQGQSPTLYLNAAALTKIAPVESSEPTELTVESASEPASGEASPEPAAEASVDLSDVTAEVKVEETAAPEYVAAA